MFVISRLLMWGCFWLVSILVVGVVMMEKFDVKCVGFRLGVFRVLSRWFSCLKSGVSVCVGMWLCRLG